MVFPEIVQNIQFEFEEALIHNLAWTEGIITTDLLKKRNGLSASSAKQILDCAYRKGLLERTAPDSFKRKPPEQPKITSVFQHAAKSGLKPKSLVRSIDFMPASKEIARKLGLSENEPIYQQKRSRLINDLVVANQCNSIPACITPSLEKIDLENQSFQVILEKKYHAVVHAIQEDYSLAEPTPEDRQILDLQDNVKVVVVHRLSLSATSMPLVWADIHVNPDHFHLVEKLWPQGAKLLASQNKGGTT